MTDIDDLDERLRAVERTLTESETAVSDLDDRAELTARLDDLEAEVADLAERVDELDAGLQAVRGYVGNVRQVDEDIERRADAAIATVERLEARLDDHEQDAQVPDSSSEYEPSQPFGSAEGDTTRPERTAGQRQPRQRAESDSPGQRARRVMESATDGGNRQSEPAEPEQIGTDGGTERYRRHRDRDDGGGVLARVRDAFR